MADKSEHGDGAETHWQNTLSKPAERQWLGGQEAGWLGSEDIDGTPWTAATCA